MVRHVKDRVLLIGPSSLLKRSQFMLVDLDEV